MAGAGRHAPGLEPERRARPLHGGEHTGGAAGGLGARQRLDLHAQPAAPGDGEAKPPAFPLQPRQDLGVQLPHLLQEHRARRHDVRDARLELDAAEVGHAPAAALLHDVLAGPERIVGRAEEGVLPPRHRRGPRMVRLADEREAIAVDPHDPLHDADGDAGGLEMRSLLDVKLDIRRERPGIAFRLRRLEGVEARAGHGVDQPLPVGRAEVGDQLRVELARERARAEQAPVAPFLIAPRRHRQGEPRPDPRFVDRVQALEPGQDAEGPVQGPALGHRVDV